MGATTSLQDTGLLDALTGSFRGHTGYQAAAVTPIVAGSGQVLALASRGELDVVITHSPGAEAALEAEGHVIDRRPFMHNFFVLVGPDGDPAGIGDAGSIDEAFRLMARRGSVFVSRGDGSGTHLRELAIWSRIGVEPAGQPWYQESGSGQGQSLLLASDRGAYTLVDSATFTVFSERLALTAFQRDTEPNVYSVMRVNPARHDVQDVPALAFADFLTSGEGQALIAEFGREEYGQPLFSPGTGAAAVAPALTR